MSNHFFPAKSLIWETDSIFTVTHGGSLAYWATEFDNNRNVDWWYVEDGSPFTYSMLLASTGVLSGILRAGATVSTDSIEIFEIFGTDFWIDLFEEGAFKAPFVDDPAKGSVDEVNLSLPLSQSFKDIYSQVLSEYDNYVALDFEKANKWDAINFTDVVSELIWDWEVGELALFLMGWPESGFFADAIDIYTGLDSKGATLTSMFRMRSRLFLERVNKFEWANNTGQYSSYNHSRA